jgi:hypothetical protein
MMRNCYILLLALTPQIAFADIYKVFWPEENQRGTAGWDAVKIVNISSNTILDGSMAGVYTQDLTPLKTRAATAAGGSLYQLVHSLDALGGGGPTVIDFSGSNITLRAEQGISLNPLGGANPSYTYDVVYKVDAATGELLETRLVASSTSEQVLADAAGFTVDLEESDLNRSGAGTSFQSYASNVTTEGTVNIVTKGGLITEQLSNPDGSSLLRKEDDGTVHIGQNSIVLADELVSTSGNDEVYSSSGVLQLGNDDNHRTVIRGNLEVQNPTQGNHAANKTYVDTGDAATLSSAKTYSDTGDAATLSSAKTYSNGIAAMALAASQINLSADPKSTLTFGVGFGSMGGENAFALGLGGTNQNTNMRYSATASYSDATNKVAVGAGVSWSLR